MMEIIMRSWDIREFHVRVNLASLIWRVRVPIRRAITPIRSLLNQIRQVLFLMTHIRSYAPYRSHLLPPSLVVSSTTLPSSQNSKLNHPSVSLHAMIMSSHQVQYPPSTAYTKYSIHPRLFVFPSFSQLRVDP